MQLPLPLRYPDRFVTTSTLSVLSAFLSPDLTHITLNVSHFLSLALLIGTELILGPPQVMWTLCHLDPGAVGDAQWPMSDSLLVDSFKQLTWKQGRCLPLNVPRRHSLEITGESQTSLHAPAPKSNATSLRALMPIWSLIIFQPPLRRALGPDFPTIV